MIRFVLAAVALPLVFSTGIPLPTHGPKDMPPRAFKMVHDHLKSIKQFDLAKLGIPLEKSLRLAGSVDGRKGTRVLVAVSPKKVETLVRWYQHRLHGWKLEGHVPGKAASFMPTKGPAKVSVSVCLDGSYQLFRCASVVRFYRSTGH